MRTKQQDAASIAGRMNDLKEVYVALEAEKASLMERHIKGKYEIPPLEYRLESMAEHVKNVEALQGRVVQLREARQNTHLFDFKKRKATDEKIALATQELERARDYFVKRFQLEPNQAYVEMKLLQEELCVRKDSLEAMQVRVEVIRDKQASLELEYRTKRLLNELRPDREQIDRLLEQMREPPGSVCDRQIRERASSRLETVTDLEFERIAEKLPTYPAHILTNIREQAKERERRLEAERERDRTFERSR